MAPPTALLPAQAFGNPGGTVLCWLGIAGFLISSRGTLLAVDPLLQAVGSTPADHAWQNEAPKAGQRTFRDEDSCGFWIEIL